MASVANIIKVTNLIVNYKPQIIRPKKQLTETDPLAFVL